MLNSSSPALPTNNMCNTVIGLSSIVEEDCGVSCQIRGDMNHDGDINIADLTYLVSYMFKNGPAPISFEEGDIDLNGEINITDLTFTVNYFFKSGAAPSPCSK